MGWGHWVGVRGVIDLGRCGSLSQEFDHRSPFSMCRRCCAKSLGCEHPVEEDEAEAVKDTTTAPRSFLYAVLNVYEFADRFGIACEWSGRGIEFAASSGVGCLRSRENLD